MWQLFDFFETSAPGGVFLVGFTDGMYCHDEIHLGQDRGGRAIFLDFQYPVGSAGENQPLDSP